MSLNRIYKETKPEIDKLKKELLSMVRDFIYDLETEDRVIVLQRRKLAEFQARFESFTNNRTAPVLKHLGRKIRDALVLSVENFKEDGAEIDDVAYIEQALGIHNGKIYRQRNGKMTVLFSLGAMSVIENDILILINSSFTGMVTRTDLWGAAERSINRKFYDFFEVYAMGAIFQAYNAAQLSFARKYKYEKFIYAGDIIEESREFCVQRAGNEFWRKDGESWNEQEWRGKIPGVDFFIQVGGYNCLHHIEWIKEE